MNVFNPFDTFFKWRLDRLLIYGIILIFSLLVRILCVAHDGFFCDVPGSLEAIRSGVMHIQLPGYVCYHLVVKLISFFTVDLLSAFFVFTMACGLLSTLYVMLSAEILGGLGAAMAAGIVSGFGLLDVYFSCTGTSYPSDEMATSAILYYGLRTFCYQGLSMDVLLSELWCIFGIFMRPLSGVWLIPAVIYIFWNHRSKSLLRITLTILFISFFIFILLQIPYYKSFNELVSTSASVAEAGSLRSLFSLTGILRFLTFPVYFFHVWLFFGIILFVKNWRFGFSIQNKIVLKFLLILIVPYLLVLFKHFPHAGYLCLLAPVIIVFPIIFPSSQWVRIQVGVVFVCISLIQIFVLQPIAPTTIMRCVLDAYYLQYSKEGISKNMFESLALLAWKNGIWTEKIPASRTQQAINIYGKPNGSNTKRLDHNLSKEK